MKVVSGLKTSSLQTQVRTRPPIKVCMHVLGCARTDVRVMREATALVEAGFAVSIVDIECNRELPRVEEIRGVHVRHIILPSWLTPTRFKPWFLIKLVQAFICGVSQMTRVPADIYHAHDEIALPACYIAARLRHKPLIFDAHELPMSEPSVNRWLRLRALATCLLTYFIRYCAGVITVSAPIAAKIGHDYHLSEVTLVRNIPPYHVVAKTDRLRQYLGLGPNARIALYQGGLSPDRGLDRLISAARFLDDDHLLVIMGDGPQTIKSELAALIASEEVADRVKIIPAVPYKELLVWTGSANIGLIIYSLDYSPNVSMCLPNKLFEYVMAGLPILASQLEAVADIINSFHVGHVLSSLEPCAIAEAINGMLADSAALEQMQHNALCIAQSDFCWEKEQKQLVHLYHTILSKSMQ